MCLEIIVNFCLKAAPKFEARTSHTSPANFRPKTCLSARLAKETLPFP